MAERVNFEEIKYTCRDIVLGKLNFQPNDIRVEFYYKLEELRDYMRVRVDLVDGDTLHYTVALDDRVSCDKDMNALWLHLDQAARELNNAFERPRNGFGKLPKDSPYYAPEPPSAQAVGDNGSEERREPDSVYPPW